MIIAILILALVLRLVNLNQSLWLDEAVQAITAKASLTGIFQEITGDFHPPLFHLLMHFWVRIFGASEISLRMPSVLFGVGTVYLVYLIGQTLGSKKWGLIPALLFATAPFHIYYSQEARMYSAVTFFIAGSIYFFLKIIKDDKESLGDRKAMAYFLFTLLALYTDYYAFLILPLQAVFLILKKKYKYFIFYFLFFIFYLPWLPMLAIQLKAGRSATQILPGWGKLVNLSFVKALPLTLVKFSLGRITFFDKRIYALVAFFLAGVYGTLIIKGARKSFAIISWLFFPILIAWLGSWFIPNYQPFRLLLCLPAFYLLLVFGIQTLRRSFKIFAIALILLVNLASLAVYFKDPYFSREDWRGLVNFAKERKSAVLFLPSSTSLWPIRYYDPESRLKILVGKEGLGEVDKINDLGKEKNIYYVRYLTELFDPNGLILRKLSQVGYTKTKEISFNQISVWEFAKK